ncbi:ribonuclease [Bacillus sp. DNRA2]|uniref:YlzJ-like family protein n=1 Tax=Bacillus sp. DNRA2 TaxID=2723053 RepID=UPI00145D0EED|nr:YlzJ-like family protein [Bacillus sp. DNRA2]NMD69534.1 ribonuclease [Bacillus sp. DNRA2]
MILYTMMPHELIFPETSQTDSNMMLVTYEGIPVMVEKTDTQDYRVVRVVSTDPQHYLNGKVTPGTKISF